MLSLLLIFMTACATAPQTEDLTPAPEVTNDEKSLHDMVQNSDQFGLEELFKVDVDVNERNSEGQTPLHVASAAGNTAIMKLLLMQEADTDSRDNSGNTPLHLALANSHELAAALLAAYEADIYIQNNEGVTPVESAFNKGMIYLNAVLNEKNVNAGLIQGESLAHLASRAGSAPAMQLLIDLNADINKRNSEGKLPLDLALDNRNSLEKARCASLLIRNGSYKGQDEDFEYVFLLFNQSDIDTRFEFGQTALHLAAERGHEGFVRLLLELNADIAARDKPGNIPLHSAVRGGYRNIVSLLLDAGSDVNTTDYNSNVPLHMALTLDKNIDILQRLLNAGADVNAKNSFGNTPLHLTVTLNRERSAAELLIQYNATIESRNKRGNTALLEAVEKENSEIAMLLLEKDADIFARNKQGISPLSQAIRKGVTLLSWFLTSESINSQDNEGNSPLHMAVQQEAPLDVVRFLLENAADINSRNLSGETPLHLATENGNLELTGLFLKNGGDFYMDNNNGETHPW